MKKKIIGLVFIIFFSIFSGVAYGEDNTKDYEQTKDSIDQYIDNQLNKVNTDDIEKYIKEDNIVKDVNLKTYIKNLISGDANILDLFDKEKIDITLDYRQAYYKTGQSFLDVVADKKMTLEDFKEEEIEQ